jgi:hypothetical protein
MDYVALAILAFEIIKWLDANKKKKVTTKQIKAVAESVGQGKQLAKVEKKGALPDLVWAINRLRGIK